MISCVKIPERIIKRFSARIRILSSHHCTEGGTQLPDRHQYQQKYRQRQKEKLRLLKEMQPGRYIRNNPDYERILEAIREEQAEDRHRV